MPTQPPALPNLWLGTRQPDGSVTLDPAEAEYVHQLLASIRIAEVRLHFSDRAVQDARYVAHVLRDGAAALGRQVEPCMYRADETLPDGMCARRTTTRLAVVSGGLPPWPKRDDGARLADAWHGRLRRFPPAPGGAAFVIERHQLREPGFEPVAQTDQAHSAGGLAPRALNKVEGVYDGQG